jgi:hypothetical protein
MDAVALSLDPVPALNTRRPKLFGLEVTATSPQCLAPGTQPLAAVIDTGASRSAVLRQLLNASVVSRLPTDEVGLADGRRIYLPTLDITLYIGIINRTLALPGVFVTDSAHLILGCDFLRRAPAILLLHAAERFGQLLFP